ncbi:MAG: hypothetical protein RBT11_10560 [Desulfobacterales bacterium]|jgi:predicted Rossmann fold nucleotide-binding protein DprA/Smf involved in DNA uptake|nr:hypothetical protein [Desulfobacterales bacterium]
MKSFKKQLTDIAAALLKLAKQVEALSGDAEPAKPVQPAKKAVVKKAAATPKKQVAPGKEKIAKAKEKPAGKPETVLEQVLDVISKSRKGASIDKLKEKTGLQPRQLSNALYKLTKKGSVEARARGIYFKKK